MTEPIESTQVRPYAVPWRQGLKQAVYVQDLGSLLALLSCKCRINVRDVRDLRQHYFGYDKQTGWSAWLVSYRGSAILWSNGPVPGLQRLHLVESEMARRSGSLDVASIASAVSVGAHRPQAASTSSEGHDTAGENLDAGLNGSLSPVGPAGTRSRA